MKDIQTALDNLEAGLGNKKGDPKIAFFPDVEKRKAELQQGLTVIPFGIEPEVDAATSVGGLPLGCIVELFGTESGGKSYLSLKLIASAQKLGFRACLIDAEHSFVKDWAEMHGVKTDKLLFGEDFDYGEETLQYVLALIKGKLADVIVVDSVAALVPKAEMEAKFEDAQMGVVARMLSRALKQIAHAAGQHGVLVVFINQIREKPGTMFGDPETTPGGRALKFAAHLRLRVHKVGTEFEEVGSGDKKQKLPVSMKSKVRFMKNKVGTPFKDAEFTIYFNAAHNTNEVKLVNAAYDLRVLKRKTNEDGKLEYVWGKGKDVEFTSCEESASMAEWLTSNHKWAELIELVKEKAGQGNAMTPELDNLCKEVLVTDVEIAKAEQV